MRCMQKRQKPVDIGCCWMEQKKEGKARVWNVDSKGVIVSSTNWFDQVSSYGTGKQSLEWMILMERLGSPQDRSVEMGVVLHSQARYQLLASSDPDSFVQLQNSSGVTYSDASSSVWMRCMPGMWVLDMKCCEMEQAKGRQGKYLDCW